MVAIRSPALPARLLIVAFLLAALSARCSRHGTPKKAGTLVAKPSQSAALAPPERKAQALPATIPRNGGARAVSGTLGVVTSVEAQATRAGIRILEQGGNAIDAAVAVAYALAVTHPSAGNIGGGGFMLVRQKGQATVAIDFRETAPKALTGHKFNEMIVKGGIGAMSVGVPGSVAGLNLAHSRFGRLQLVEVMAPAIALAKIGHRVGLRQAATFSWNWEWLKHDPGAVQSFSDARAGPEPSGAGAPRATRQPKQAGSWLRRADLGATLERISKAGDAGFYEGTTARMLVKTLAEQGGFLTLDDLKSYRAILREPLALHYRGFEVQVMPPPSAGGVAVAQMLLMLEQLGAHRLPRESPDQLHLFIEASRRAQAERRFSVLDPDALPVAELARRRHNWLDATYLTRKTPIDRASATPSVKVHPLYAAALSELPHTTHFAVADAEGNVVSCTTTLSSGFGAKILVPGAGIVLNNSVASFASAGDNVPTAGRRTTSSMAPTLVLANGAPVLVLGTPGGDTIPSTIVQVLRNVIDFGMALDDAVDAPRIHHGFAPDLVRFESKNPPPKAVLVALGKRGHRFPNVGVGMGDANSILMAGNVAYAYADRREGGLALAARQPSAQNAAASPAKSAH